MLLAVGSSAFHRGRFHVSIGVYPGKQMEVTTRLRQSGSHSTVVSHN